MNLNFGLSCIVSNAGGVPSHDLRTLSTEKSLEIIYKGKIYQKPDRIGTL